MGCHAWHRALRVRTLKTWTIETLSGAAATTAVLQAQAAATCTRTPP
jgi:hypothetical protein